MKWLVLIVTLVDHSVLNDMSSSSDQIESRPEDRKMPTGALYCWLIYLLKCNCISITFLCTCTTLAVALGDFTLICCLLFQMYIRHTGIALLNLLAEYSQIDRSEVICPELRWSGGVGLIGVGRGWVWVGFEADLKVIIMWRMWKCHYMMLVPMCHSSWLTGDSGFAYENIHVPNTRSFHNFSYCSAVVVLCCKWLLCQCPCKTQGLLSKEKLPVRQKRTLN